MAELRLVALSQKSSDNDMLEAIRFACNEANRDYYVGKCMISDTMQDPMLYAEIIYLLNILAEKEIPEGYITKQIFLEGIIKSLQDKLPKNLVAFHEERFKAIQREDEDQLGKWKEKLPKDAHPFNALVKVFEDKNGIRRRRQSKR